MPTEPLFTLTKFNTPLEVTGKDAISLLITRLILLEPGTIQSHPDMGVGIVSRYRYSELNNGGGQNLQNDIREQIQTYLPPEFGGAQVKVSENKTSYIIDIQIDDTIYSYNYDTSNNTLDAIRTK